VFDDAIALAVRELDRIRASAKQARGDERVRLIDALARTDRVVVAASTATIDETTAAALRREAEAELAPFGSRLAPEARARALAAAFERLVREALGIPVIAYE
jgi:predicted dinucleotide-utilizing enzyme